MRWSAALATRELSDDTLKSLASRVIRDGLKIGGVDFYPYGICIDYFSGRPVSIEAFLKDITFRAVKLFNPLVITPEGELRPFTFDFRPGFDLGPIDGLAGGIAPDGPAAVATVTGCSLGLLAGQAGFEAWFGWARDVARGEVSLSA